tara:strand:+ start:177 stop:392 length:216 start_codon:yes stop_codon:yes gene_type:complete
MKCTHHYVIEPPDGAKSGSGLVSMGVCKNCGDKKVHSNDSETNKVTLRQVRTGKWRQVRNFIIGNGTTREK